MNGALFLRPEPHGGPSPPDLRAVASFRGSSPVFVDQDCENRVHVQNQARSSPENDFPFASRGRGLPVIRAITLTLPSESRPGEDSITSGCDRACSLVIHDNDAIGNFASWTRPRTARSARMSTPDQRSSSIAPIAIPTGSSPATNCRAGAPRGAGARGARRPSFT
jgi:hypothetical protein